MAMTLGRTTPRRPAGLGSGRADVRPPGWVVAPFADLFAANTERAHQRDRNTDLPALRVDQVVGALVEHQVTHPREPDVFDDPGMEAIACGRSPGTARTPRRRAGPARRTVAKGIGGQALPEHRRRLFRRIGDVVEESFAHR